MLLFSFDFFRKKGFRVERNLKWVKKRTFTWGYFNLCLLLYSFVIALGNGALTSEYSAFTAFFNYFIMVFFFSFVLEEYFTDEVQFCNAMIVATLIQSSIVILSLLPSVRILLENIQYGDIARYSDRVIGIGITGATGSIYLFTGLFANAYILLFNKIQWKYILSFITILIAIAFVARTGFYVSIVILLFIVFFGSGGINIKIKRNIMFFSLFILLSLGTYIFIKKVEVNLNLIEYTIGRLDEIFKPSNSKTLKTISNMNIPSLTFETLIGTGVEKGYTSNGELIWHDSGYVQRYMSVGFVMALLSYLSLTIYINSLIKKVKQSKKRMFFRLLLVLMLFIEIKEPFIFTLAYPFVLLILLRLTVKSYVSKEKREEISL